MTKKIKPEPVVEFPRWHASVKPRRGWKHPPGSASESSASRWRALWEAEHKESLRIFWKLIQSGSLTKEQFEACIAHIQRLHETGPRAQTLAIYEHEPEFWKGLTRTSGLG